MKKHFNLFFVILLMFTTFLLIGCSAQNKESDDQRNNANSQNQNNDTKSGNSGNYKRDVLSDTGWAYSGDDDLYKNTGIHFTADGYIRGWKERDGEIYTDYESVEYSINGKKITTYNDIDGVSTTASFKLKKETLIFENEGEKMQYSKVDMTLPKYKTMYNVPNPGP